jgi:hypothetical protein
VNADGLLSVSHLYDVYAGALERLARAGQIHGHDYENAVQKLHQMRKESDVEGQSSRRKGKLVQILQSAILVKLFSTWSYKHSNPDF